MTAAKMKQKQKKEEMLTHNKLKSLSYIAKHDTASTTTKEF